MQYKMIYLSKPDITDREKKAVLDVLDSGMLASGPKVKEFEQKFEEYNKVSHAICVSNGTTALHAGLLASGIEPNDKIITTPFTFIASANSILFCGGKVVFADIDEKNFNLDPNKVEDILKKQNDVKAIMLVHLYGNSCDIDAFLYLSEKYGVKLFEDCAQSVGATYKNKMTGSFGEFGTYSFYATKNMMTGEGGMVVTSNDKIAEKVRKIINHGRSDRYFHTELGYNFRLTDLQASLGIVQLERVEEFIEKRTNNAEYFNENLKNLEWIQLPKLTENNRHVFHQYTLRVSTTIRDKFVDYLNENGVNATPIYPIPLNKQPIYEAIEKFSCPISEAIANEVVCLPVHTKLTEQDLVKIVDTIKRFEI
jgi:dTDP-4-amino-4,6-dideoxygalactose transaminase